MTRMPVRPPESRPSLNWVEEQLAQTRWLMLIALTALFFPLMWLFSGVGLFVARYPAARRKAIILFVACSAYAVLLGALIYSVTREDF